MAQGTKMTTKITADVIADGAITGTQLANNSINGSKIALGSDAQGDVMYYNGTDWARLAAGTSGYFLKTQGAGANPAWAAAGFTSSNIRLNGNNGSTVNFTSSAQVLVSTYFSQGFANGDLSWNSSTGRVTAAAAGVYQISLIIYIQTGSANGNGRFDIRVDGSTTHLLHTGNGADGTVCVSFLVSLTAGQYIDIVADGFDLPGAYMGPSHSTFSMHRVG